jgi:hypothetical protein
MSSQAIEKQSIFTSKDEIARLPFGKPRNDREVAPKEIATPAWGGLAMTTNRLENFELYDITFPFPTLLKNWIFSQIIISSRYSLSISKTYTHASNDSAMKDFRKEASQG